MKVAHLTSVHQPHDIRIFYKECQKLAQAGHEVVLIVPHERHQTVDGIRTRAIPPPASRPGRMIGTTWRILKAAIEESADVYHFHDPELIPVGLALKALGKPVIYDAHEEIPKQILTKYWISPWLRCWVAKGAGIAELLGARAFDRVVAATPAIARRFPKEKTFIVQNFPNPSELAPAGRCPYAERPPGVVYIGGISEIRGIREMVRAMTMVHPPLRARLLLAGLFDPPDLEAEVTQMPGWEFVDYQGWQSREGIARVLEQARVGLVLLQPAPQFLESYPVKLFEYMSAGIPVVVSDFPLWREIVEEASCGLWVDPLDPKAIAEAIEWLLRNGREAEAMGRNGKEAVRARFNWSSEGEKLLDLYRTLSPVAATQLLE